MPNYLKNSRDQVLDNGHRNPNPNESNKFLRTFMQRIHNGTGITKVVYWSWFFVVKPNCIGTIASFIQMKLPRTQIGYHYHFGQTIWTAFNPYVNCRHLGSWSQNQTANRFTLSILRIFNWAMRACITLDYREYWKRYSCCGNKIDHLSWYLDRMKCHN